MPDDRKQSPAYLSYRTLKSTIRSIAHEGRPPPRIDSSVLSKMSGSARTQFLGALRFLSLISEDDRPTDRLVSLCAANDSEWKSVMGSILKEKYPSQLAALKDGTPATFKESFVGVSASLVTPACRFLWSAAKDAGLPISGHIKEISNAPRTSKKAGSKLATESGDGSGGDDDAPREDESKVPASIQDRLLEKFPAFDPGWDDVRQAAWFSAYEKLVALSTKGGGS